MNKLELLRYVSDLEEFSESDFTAEELEEYLAYARGAEQPLSPYEWKAQYFAYYDDVKDKSLKRQDW